MTLLIIVATVMSMEITCDLNKRNKRNKTLEDRGLDFMDAVHVFAGQHFTAEDNRKNYGEIRQITVGFFTWPHGDCGMGTTR